MNKVNELIGRLNSGNHGSGFNAISTDDLTGMSNNRVQLEAPPNVEFKKVVGSDF